MLRRHNSDIRNEILGDVNAGDQLLVNSNYGEQIYVVDRTTKTMVFAGPLCFRKRDGISVGEDPFRPGADRIIPPSMRSRFYARPVTREKANQLKAKWAEEIAQRKKEQKP